MIDDLAKYMRGTTYAGKMGDLLFQAASAFLHQSLIIIELRNEGDYCLPVSPDSGLFNCHEEIAYPAILVRQGDHYEELGLPEESRKEAVALLQDFKTKNRGVTLRIKGQRITPIATSTPMENNDNDSPGESQGDHQTQVLCALFVCLFVCSYNWLNFLLNNVSSSGALSRQQGVGIFCRNRGGGPQHTGTL